MGMAVSSPVIVGSSIVGVVPPSSGGGAGVWSDEVVLSDCKYKKKHTGGINWFQVYLNFPHEYICFVKCGVLYYYIVVYGLYIG